jgi:hypothetical protein
VGEDGARLNTANILSSMKILISIQFFVTKTRVYYEQSALSFEDLTHSKSFKKCHCLEAVQGQIVIAHAHFTDQAFPNGNMEIHANRISLT